jgi:hypothetical protein
METAQLLHLTLETTFGLTSRQVAQWSGFRLWITQQPTSIRLHYLAGTILQALLVLLLFVGPIQLLLQAFRSMTQITQLLFAAGSTLCLIRNSELDNDNDSYRNKDAGDCCCLNRVHLYTLRRHRFANYLVWPLYLYLPANVFLANETSTEMVRSNYSGKAIVWIRFR